MKLLYRIIFRLFAVLTVLLTAWGFLFYVAIIEEINDEVDDSLEDYSENIITRALTGQALPSRSDGTNNSYYLTAITRQQAEAVDHIRYSDEEVYILEKKETEPARVLKTIFKDRNGQYFELTVSTPSIEKEDLQEAILNWIVLLYFALLFSILLINIWVFYRSMRPLYILLNWLDHYTIGQHSTPPDLKTDIPEFKKLQEAAIQSDKRNQAIFEQQKQFIGNASHELQTPLAICQNRLEMITEGELTEEQLSEISKIQETLSYIIRLNKSLLFLSKIENGQFQDTKEVCLNDIIKRQIEDYREIYDYKNICLNLTDPARLIVQMNETLATTLITNLLKNAYVHNHSQGEIQITISKHQLTFSNTGEATALDNTKIFQRFYQGKQANPGSTGIGLSITEAICKLYNIQIQYSYAEKHRFLLQFPV